MKESGSDELFLQITHAVSLGTDDGSVPSGAVLVSESRRVVSYGHNGSPFGYSTHSYDECPFGKNIERKSDVQGFFEYPPCHHAEYQAVTKAHEEERSGSTIYLSHRPCTECHELILRSGITMMVWTTPDGRVAHERQYH